MRAPRAAATPVAIAMEELKQPRTTQKNIRDNAPWDQFPNQTIDIEAAATSRSAQLMRISFFAPELAAEERGTGVTGLDITGPALSERSAGP